MPTKLQWSVTGGGLLAFGLMSPLIHAEMTKFPVSLSVQNQSGMALSTLSFSPPGKNQWNDTRLPEGGLPSGSAVTLTDMGHSCSRDLRISYADGYEEVRPDMNMCQPTDLLLPERSKGIGSINPSFNVINKGKSDIVEVYVSHSSSRNWGQNRLGKGQAVKPGAAFAVYLPSGSCTYDAQVVYKDGSKSHQKAVDTCTISFIAFP